MNERKGNDDICNFFNIVVKENHDLISDIAREESTEAAALPKLLLDLVEQVEGGGKASQRQADAENGDVEGNGEIDRKEDDLQEEDIAHNLPKVNCLYKRQTYGFFLHRIFITSIIMSKLDSYYYTDILTEKGPKIGPKDRCWSLLFFLFLIYIIFYS